MQAELAALRDDVAPAVLAEPLPLEETAERYVRPQLRQVRAPVQPLRVEHASDSSRSLWVAGETLGHTV